MDNEAIEYWKTFEAETGEIVEARGMGALHGSGQPEGGTWGLLVLTDKSFRFRHLPSENWLASIFKAGGRTSANKAFEIVVPRGEVLESQKPKLGFISRILSPPYPRFSVHVRGDGTEQIHEFSVDSSSGFLKALEKAMVPLS